MDFVDKEDNIPLRTYNLVDHTFQALFKLALILRTGQQCAHIEREELLLAQIFRHIASDNAFCNAFYDGRLSRSRLTNQDRIILCTPTQNLQYAPNFFISPYHGVQLSAARFFDQVACKFGQCLIRLLARSRRSLPPAAQFVNRFFQPIFRQAGIVQQLRRTARRCEQRQQHRLKPHKAIAHLLRNVYGLGQSRVGFSI